MPSVILSLLFTKRIRPICDEKHHRYGGTYQRVGKGVGWWWLDPKHYWRYRINWKKDRGGRGADIRKKASWGRFWSRDQPYASKWKRWGRERGDRERNREVWGAGRGSCGQRWTWVKRAHRGAPCYWGERWVWRVQLLGVASESHQIRPRRCQSSCLEDQRRQICHLETKYRLLRRKRNCFFHTSRSYWQMECRCLPFIRGTINVQINKLEDHYWFQFTCWQI